MGTAVIGAGFALLGVDQIVCHHCARWVRFRSGHRAGAAQILPLSRNENARCGKDLPHRACWFQGYQTVGQAKPSPSGSREG